MKSLKHKHAYSKKIVCKDLSGDSSYLKAYQQRIKQMANSYTQLHLQFVFAVQFRKALIQIEWKERLHQYITGIFQQNGHKMLQINSMRDHIHILVGFRPNQAVSAVVQNVKSESSKWINREFYSPKMFKWQEGYGAFSYSKSHVNKVIRYIQRQEEHHRKISFQEEYLKLLDAFEIDYDEKYIFRPLE